MDKKAYQLLDTYFRDHFYPFTKHHIDSYREFLRKYIPDVIRSYNPITMVKFHNNKEEDLELKVEIFIGGLEGNLIYIDRPTILDKDGNPLILTPQEARLKNLTYSTNLYADVLVRYEIAGRPAPIEKVFSHILVGQIPLMVHSDGCVLHQQGPKVLQAFDECPYDQGGYFIIDGKEKVVISQERMVTNRLFIEPSKDPRFKYKGWVRCTTETGEAALLPKTMEFYVLDPTANASSIQEDIEEEGQEEEPEESMKDTSVRIKYRGAILVSIPNIKSGKNTQKIPLFQLFRALGVESDKEILEHILGPLDENVPQEYIDFIMPSLRHCTDKNVHIYSQMDAIEHLKNHVRYQSNEYVHSILTNDVFPNMGTDYQKKARYLGYLIHYMMEMILEVKPMTDRDAFGYKRIDLSGFLLSQLFHNIYKRFRKHCRDLLDQEYHYGPTRNTGHFEEMIRKENIQKIISPLFITERMQRSLKGLWGSSDSDEKQEKVQDLSRISYIGFLSNLRRVNTPLDRSIKIVSPHRLNAQQWGIVCPFESPDGASIGYLKNLALLSHVSFGTNPIDLMGDENNCLMDLGLILLMFVSPSEGHVLTKVFLNGEWVGCVKNPDEFTYRFKLLRRNSLINIFTSISWKINLNEIRIQTDPGRGCRPLIIVEKEVPRLPKSFDNMSWFDLVFGGLTPKSERMEEMYYKGSYVSPFKMKEFLSLPRDEVWKALEKTQCYIEFIDIEESDTRMIAMYPKDIYGYTTHLEIHPSTILSVVTNNIPFANHNFAARNIFYGAQSKQAVGIYATNFSKRFDTAAYILHYSQKALITTRNSHYISNDKLPAGFNTIVAIATYSGYNQEDGIIINKNSLDRGMFQCTSYKSYSAQESSQNKYDYVMMANPLKVKKDLQVEVDRLRDESIYQLLDDNGVIIPESFVTKGSKLAVIGMVHVKEELKEVRKGVKVETQMVKSYKDLSITTGVHHYGTIDKVYVDHSGVATDYNRVCKVRFRKIRRPELGDKLCSRHGQKGVVGMILPEEDMPFTKDGIVPDIIINPHAIPSRMTIGHLVECVFAKLCSMEGAIGDGNVFIPVDFDDIGTRLEDLNFERNGNEVLYNGKTGTQIESDIFIGPTFYLRLKHMVADKMHSRDKGPRDQLTRQPPSGRSKEGGLRIGEMERDVLLSYGFSQFAKESVMERSDKYTWAVCKSCGRASLYNPSQHIYECISCKSHDIAVVQTPYAFKLLVQEMETMGITPRLITDTVDYEWNDEEFFEDEEEQSGGQTYTEIPVKTEEEINQQVSNEKELEPIVEGDDEEEEEGEENGNGDEEEEDEEEEEEDEEEEEEYAARAQEEGEANGEYKIGGAGTKNKEDNQDDNILIDDVSINDEDEEVNIKDTHEESSDIKIIELDMH